MERKTDRQKERQKEKEYEINISTRILQPQTKTSKRTVLQPNTSISTSHSTSCLTSVRSRPDNKPHQFIDLTPRSQDLPYDITEVKHRSAALGHRWSLLKVKAFSIISQDVSVHSGARSGVISTLHFISCVYVLCDFQVYRLVSVRLGRSDSAGAVHR